MKTLRFICNHHPEYDEIIPNTIGKNLINGCLDWRHYIGGIYLHGILEEENHYDCVDLIDVDGLPTYEEDCTPDRVVLCDLPTGVIPCEVYGHDNPCTAFIWYYTLGGYKRWRGLIVDNDDVYAYNYAKKQYDERRRNL